MVEKLWPFAHQIADAGGVEDGLHVWAPANDLRCRRDRRHRPRRSDAAEDDPRVPDALVGPSDRARTLDARRITADCGHECWIGEASHKTVVNPLLSTETVCMRCVDRDELRRQLAEQGGPMAVPGTREELNRHMGVAAVDQMRAEFGIQEHDPAACE